MTENLRGDWWRDELHPAMRSYLIRFAPGLYEYPHSKEEMDALRTVFEEHLHPEALYRVIYGDDYGSALVDFPVGDKEQKEYEGFGLTLYSELPDTEWDTSIFTVGAWNGRRDDDPSWNRMNVVHIAKSDEEGGAGCFIVQTTLPGRANKPHPWIELDHGGYRYTSYFKELAETHDSTCLRGQWMTGRDEEKWFDKLIPWLKRHPMDAQVWTCIFHTNRPLGTVKDYLWWWERQREDFEVYWDKVLTGTKKHLGEPGTDLSDSLRLIPFREINFVGPLTIGEVLYNGGSYRVPEATEEADLFVVFGRTNEERKPCIIAFRNTRDEAKALVTRIKAEGLTVVPDA